ncbi:hypothetical protein [Novosphingobium colocasiae]|uniref:hypothetical protein n=1 Tax=Novosphingobium colocasiae TaxID=1256513 RepID=UPI0035B2827F
MTPALRSGLWWSMAILLACCAALLQLDLWTQTRPTLARLVPASFQSRAATFSANQAIEQGDWTKARALSTRALRHRPIPASSLSALALARSQAGTIADETAWAALAEAAARGWRDGAAQTGALAMAMEVGRYDVAAMRMDALWRTRIATSGAEPMLKAAFAEPRLRAELAKRYAAGVPWATDFLSWAGANVPPDQLGDFLDQAAAGGARPDCGVIADVALKSVQAGKGAMARQLWTRFCNGRSAGSETRLVAPAGDDNLTGPFDWTFPVGADVTRSFDRRGTLHYQAHGLVRAPLAQRWADLAPGEHSVTLRHAGGDPVLTVQCVAAGQSSRPISAAFVYGVASFTVAAEGCAAQRLTLEVERGEGAIAGVSVR